MRRFGTEVVVIEPTAEDHAAMGRNWMSTERRQDVIDTAEETVAAQLQPPRGARAARRPAEGRAAQGQAAVRARRRRWPELLVVDAPGRVRRAR